MKPGGPSGKINVPLTCGNTLNIVNLFTFMTPFEKKNLYPWDLHQGRHTLAKPPFCRTIMSHSGPHVILPWVSVIAGVEDAPTMAATDRDTIDRGYRVMNAFKEWRTAIYAVIFWCSGCRTVICWGCLGRDSWGTTTKDDNYRNSIMLCSPSHQRYSEVYITPSPSLFFYSWIWGSFLFFSITSFRNI